MASQKVLTAQKVATELQKCGVTHVVWLPDSIGRFLYPSLTGGSTFTPVPVCREGEAFAIAAGLAIGGKRPLVLIQATGMFESGDSIRGMGLDCQLPLVMLVGRGGSTAGPPGTDSAGHFVGPILQTWGVPCYSLDSDDDLFKIADAFQKAQATSQPVALLYGGGRAT